MYVAAGRVPRDETTRCLRCVRPLAEERSLLIQCGCCDRLFPWHLQCLPEDVRPYVNQAIQRAQAGAN